MKTNTVLRFAIFSLLLSGFVWTTSAQSVVHQTDAPRLQTSQMTPEKWDRFSKQVVSALASGHSGLEGGALRMIISYGDKLDVSSARLDLIRIYRSAKEDNMRRMAVVALGSLQQEWGISYLARHARDEQSQGIRHTMLSIVNEYHLAAKEPGSDINTVESGIIAQKED